MAASPLPTSTADGSSETRPGRSDQRVCARRLISRRTTGHDAGPIFERQRTQTSDLTPAIGQNHGSRAGGTIHILPAEYERPLVAPVAGRQYAYHPDLARTWFPCRFLGAGGPAAGPAGLRLVDDR